MTDHSSLQKEKNNIDIVERLSEDYCSCIPGFKDRGLIDPQCESCQTVDWRHEAAAEITRLRAEAEALRKALLAIVDRDFTFFDGYVDRYTITYGEIQQARAAIAATKEQQA